MKKITILILAAGLQACSMTSKEVYTEKRVFTYPKGKEPHLKEMYLRDGKHQEQNTYIGTNTPEPAPQPESYVSDHDLIAPVPEVNNFQTSYTPPEEEKSLDQLLEENRILQAKQHNAWLRSQM